MLYTTYFAKVNKLPQEIIPVAICLSTPPWYHGYTFKKLAPSSDVFRKLKLYHNEYAFTNDYLNETLNNLSPYDILAELKSLTNSEDIALVCYEKANTFCHRQIVMAWFQANHIPCEELNL